MSPQQAALQGFFREVGGDHEEWPPVQEVDVGRVDLGERGHRSLSSNLTESQKSYKDLKYSVEVKTRVQQISRT